MSFVPRYGARLIGPNGAYDDYGFEEHDNVLSCYVEFAGSTFPYRCAFQNATGHDVRVFLSAAGNSLCNSCHFGPMEAGFVGQCPDPEEVDLRINARGARPKEEQRLKPITIPHSNPYFAANRDIIELRVFNVGPLTRAANATLADGRLSAPASLTKQGSADWMATPEVWAHPDTVFRFVVTDGGDLLHHETARPSAATMARARTLNPPTVPSVTLPPFVALKPYVRPPMVGPVPVSQTTPRSHGPRHDASHPYGYRAIKPGTRLVVGARSERGTGSAEGRPALAEGGSGEPSQERLDMVVQQHPDVEAHLQLARYRVKLAQTLHYMKASDM